MRCGVTEDLSKLTTGGLMEHDAPVEKVAKFSTTGPPIKVACLASSLDGTGQVPLGGIQEQIATKAVARPRLKRSISRLDAERRSSTACAPRPKRHRYPTGHQQHARRRQWQRHRVQEERV